MRSLIILLTLVALAGCHSPKPSLRDQVIGTWQDENSVISYEADGNKTMEYDSGRFCMWGKWELDKDVIVTLLRGAPRSDQNSHRILKISDNEMEIENLASHSIFHAKRIGGSPSRSFSLPNWVHSIASKNSTRELLVGNWQDDTYLTTYEADGNKFMEYESGQHCRWGKWALQGDLIICLNKYL